MSIDSCGLDFGTSNSTFGFVREDGSPRLVALEDGQPTIPSVLFFSFEDDRTYFGRAALSEYVTGGDGRMMRSIKSVLGTALMDEHTRIKAQRVPFSKILELFVGELCRRAEVELGQVPHNIVAGRPVRFVDDDDAADRRAQAQLEAAVRAQGFRHVEFQFEPIAAALDSERHVTTEQLALVVDIGGGTSDFTIVRLSPERAASADRSADILATSGVHIGGTDFDRLLSMAEIMPELGLGSVTKDQTRLVPRGPYFDLATWHRINRLYTSQRLGEIKSTLREAAEPGKIEKLMAIVAHREGHLLAEHVERAKIALSEEHQVSLGFATDAVAVDVALTRERLEHAVAESVERIFFAIDQTLVQAQLGADDISLIIQTGGSTRMPIISHAIRQKFARAQTLDVDAFGSVGLGLSLDAARRF